MAKYLYQVELTRRIRCPEYGSEAYRLSSKRKDFPFGKGREFKTGDDAREVAIEWANKHWESASRISLCRLSTAGNGICETLKDDQDLCFVDDDYCLEEEWGN